MTVLRAKFLHSLHWLQSSVAANNSLAGSTSSVARRYSVSIAILVLATAIRWALDSALGNTQAYTFYFAAIALTSWYSGFWPSILAICLSYLAAHWFFVFPRHQFVFHEYSLDDYISLGGFLFSGLAIAFTSRALHNARNRSEAERQLLAREIIGRERAQQELQHAQEQLREHALTLEKRVEERTASLRESIQSLEGVCYHIAHDLRAPLRAIQGFTTILLSDYASNLDQTGKDFARRAANSAHRMDNLIFSLLEYGQLGHMQIPFSNVPLEPLVNATLDHLADEIRSSKAEIRIEQPLPSVWGNPELILQVLENLFSNALKFIPAGTIPKIHIYFEQTGKLVKLCIKDNGIGIKSEYQKRIFQIFEQLNKTDAASGTGIGLALVAKAVQRMHGRVGIQSQPRQGSVFWIELPGAISQN
ncbi:integral membrane sensor signal transduction histidine kinase [Pedosphaera parvula Ellin514]|uniref:histidine kinase n=1 Tax=Pedosphaera parvula (strain Ellin514) TaxID=320771 RepID=B9XSW3_PEDPL|nr:integral membrane sensor signal transduction histidine kinase [Pedosphaera parvula Ellin514]